MTTALPSPGGRSPCAEGSRRRRPWPISIEDGKIDIIITTGSDSVEVRGLDGKSLPGWPKAGVRAESGPHAFPGGG